MHIQATGGLGQLLFLGSIVLVVVSVVVNISFALVVLGDASLVSRRQGGTRFADPWLWTFGTLLGGPVVGCFYWVIHHGMPQGAPEPQ